MMTNRTAAVLIAFILSVPALGADWAVNFGSSGPPSGTTFINASALDGNGNLLVAGYFNGATLTLGATTLNRIGAQDVFIAKLDANTQNVIWAKNVGGAGVTTFTQGLVADGNGTTFLAGCLQNGSLSTPPVTKIGERDAYVVKFDSAGGMTWAKNFGGSGASLCGGSGLRSDGTGNLYLSGSFIGGNLTTPPLTRVGAYDAFAIKLDANGGVTWAKNFGGSDAWAVASTSAVDGSGNLYLGGYLAFGNLTTPAVPRIGNIDALVFKLDAATGNVAWVKNFGGTGGTGAVAQAVGLGVRGTSLYATGTYASRDLTTPALTRIGNTNSNDAFVFNLDTATGSVAWAKGFGGAGATTVPQALAIDGPGNVYFAGALLGANLSTPPLTLIGTRDALVVKLDAAGTVMFAKNYGGAGATAQFWGLAADGFGNAYLGGYFSNASLTTPPLTRIGSQDAMVIKQATAGVQPKLDIDGNNQYDALTDGLLVLRYLYGVNGSSLTNGAIGPGPSRSTPVDVLQYLDGMRSALDIDGNGEPDALTDGLMIMRFLFGLRGSALVAGAIGMNATRATSADVETWLAPMVQ